MYKALINFNLTLAEGESISFEQGKTYELTEEQIAQCDMTNFEKIEAAPAEEAAAETEAETATEEAATAETTEESAEETAAETAEAAQAEEVSTDDANLEG